MENNDMIPTTCIIKLFKGKKEKNHKEIVIVSYMYTCIFESHNTCTF